MSLIESISIVKKAADKLEKTRRHMGKIVKKIFANIIEKNSEFQTIKIFRDILIGQIQQETLDIEFISSDLSNMKYAPSNQLTWNSLLVNIKSILRPKRLKIFICKLSAICCY